MYTLDKYGFFKLFYFKLWLNTNVTHVFENLDSKGRKKKKKWRKKYWNLFFGEYRGRWESSKLGSTEPRDGDTTFFEASRVIYESLKSRLKCVIYEFPSPLQRNMNYIRNRFTLAFQLECSVEIWARLLARKFVRKRVSKTNIFHVYNAMYLHLGKSLFFVEIFVDENK